MKTDTRVAGNGRRVPVRREMTAGLLDKKQADIIECFCCKRMSERRIMLSWKNTEINYGFLPF